MKKAYYFKMKSQLFRIEDLYDIEASASADHIMIYMQLSELTDEVIASYFKGQGPEQSSMFYRAFTKSKERFITDQERQLKFKIQLVDQYVVGSYFAFMDMETSGKYRYFYKSSGRILVYNPESKESFNRVVTELQMQHDMLLIGDNGKQFIVIADLKGEVEGALYERAVSYEEANQLVSSHGCSYLEVNSLSGFNIDNLSQIIYQNLSDVALRKHRATTKRRCPRYDWIQILIQFLCLWFGGNVALMIFHTLFLVFSDLVFGSSSIGMEILSYFIGIAIIGAFLGIVYCLFICLEKQCDEYDESMGLLFWFVLVLGLLALGAFGYCTYYNIKSAVNETDERKYKRDIGMLITYQILPFLFIIIGIAGKCIKSGYSVNYY